MCNIIILHKLAQTCGKGCGRIKLVPMAANGGSNVLSSSEPAAAGQQLPRPARRVDNYDGSMLNSMGPESAAGRMVGGKVNLLEWC